MPFQQKLYDLNVDNKINYFYQKEDRGYNLWDHIYENVNLQTNLKINTLSIKYSHANINYESFNQEKNNIILFNSKIDKEEYSKIIHKITPTLNIIKRTEYTQIKNCENINDLNKILQKYNYIFKNLGNNPSFIKDYRQLIRQNILSVHLDNKIKTIDDIKISKFNKKINRIENKIITYLNDENNKDKSFETINNDILTIFNSILSSLDTELLINLNNHYSSLYLHNKLHNFSEIPRIKKNIDDKKKLILFLLIKNIFNLKYYRNDILSIYKNKRHLFNNLLLSLSNKNKYDNIYSLSLFMKNNSYLNIENKIIKKNYLKRTRSEIINQLTNIYPDIDTEIDNSDLLRIIGYQIIKFNEAWTEQIEKQKFYLKNFKNINIKKTYASRAEVFEDKSLFYGRKQDTTENDLEIYEEYTDKPEEELINKIKIDSFLDSLNECATRAKHVYRCLQEKKKKWI